MLCSFTTLFICIILFQNTVDLAYILSHIYTCGEVLAVRTCTLNVASVEELLDFVITAVGTQCQSAVCDAELGLVLVFLGALCSMINSLNKSYHFLILLSYVFHLGPENQEAAASL